MDACTLSSCCVCAPPLAYQATTQDKYIKPWIVAGEMGVFVWSSVFVGTHKPCSMPLLYSNLLAVAASREVIAIRDTSLNYHSIIFLKKIRRQRTQIQRERLFRRLSTPTHHHSPSCTAVALVPWFEHFKGHVRWAPFPYLSVRCK